MLLTMPRLLIQTYSFHSKPAMRPSTCLMEHILNIAKSRSLYIISSSNTLKKETYFLPFSKEQKKHPNPKGGVSNPHYLKPVGHHYDWAETV